jgi:putative ABC transport system permease protein
MNILWRKIWNDLAENKLRTFLASLSIAAGVLSLGLAFGARDLTKTRIAGARLKPHQAISARGLGSSATPNWLENLAYRWHNLPFPLLLSLRNLMRRQTRMALTLLALTAGGWMFMIVVSTYTSLNNTVERMLQSLQYDVLGAFAAPRSMESIQSLTTGIPEVTALEIWDHREATWKISPNEQLTLALWGVPAGSQVFHPLVFTGRTLQPGDEHTILLDNRTATQNHIQVGDEITLTIAGREVQWQVVGTIMNILPGSGDCIVPYAALTQATGGQGGNIVMVTSMQHDLESQLRLIEQLDQAYLSNRIEVVAYRSAKQFRDQSRLLFDIISGLLMAMALLAAVVGSIGLSGMISIHVIERRSEIGLLRAVGASAPTLVSILVGEGLCLGVLSWLLAVPLSYPGAYAFSRALGLALFDSPLNFSYSISGAVLWLVIAIILSSISSLFPALQATRIPVMEALAYE